MYRNFHPAALGVSGRQSELLEIALTYRFKGIDVDLADLAKRAKNSSVENACKYIVSAKIKIGGAELPVRWRGSDADLKGDLAQLPAIMEVAQAIGADRVYTQIPAASDSLPFHDNFKFHAERLALVGEALKPHKVKLGIGFQASPDHRAGAAYQFIHQAEAVLLLLNSIQSDNVGLILDTWHWHVGGGKLDQVKSLKMAQIVGVRLADVPAEADLTTITEQQRVLPGEGSADIAGLLSLLDMLNYEGPITTWLSPARFTGMTREAIVQRASTALDNVWTAANLKVPLKPLAALQAAQAPPPPPSPPAR